MAKDPAFLFYPGDWLGGTMGMTFEEKGAYLELLILQFNRGHMTKHMMGQTVGQLLDTLLVKFEVDEAGKYFNPRLEQEKVKREKFVKSRKNNRSGRNQYSKPPLKPAGHMTSHMENENENENKDEYEVIEGGVGETSLWPDFEDFWDAYDKKTGPKDKIQKKWDKLHHDIKEKIMAYIPNYKLCQPDKQYRKNPETFLNQKGWEDELIFKQSVKGMSAMEIRQMARNGNR